MNWLFFSENSSDLGHYFWAPQEKKSQFGGPVPTPNTGSSLVDETDEEDENAETNLFSILAKLKPVVRAAEPADNKNKSAKSRRNEFNFIADLVEETGEQPPLLRRKLRLAVWF